MCPNFATAKFSTFRTFIMAFTFADLIRSTIQMGEGKNENYPEDHCSCPVEWHQKNKLSLKYIKVDGEFKVDCSELYNYAKRCLDLIDLVREGETKEEDICNAHHPKYFGFAQRLIGLMFQSDMTTSIMNIDEGLRDDNLRKLEDDLVKICNLQKKVMGASSNEGVLEFVEKVFHLYQKFLAASCASYDDMLYFITEDEEIRKCCIPTHYDVNYKSFKKVRKAVEGFAELWLDVKEIIEKLENKC